MDDVRDIELLQEALTRFEFLINRPFLHELSKFCINPPHCSDTPICLVQIKNWPASTTASQFQFIFNALNALDEVIGVLLSFNKNKYAIYVGIKGIHAFAFQLLQDGLTAFFPGIELEVISNSSKFLNQFFCAKHYAQIALGTVIPNTTSTTPLLTTFINLMGSTAEFNAFFLASPLSYCKLTKYLDELCELYYILSIFSQSNISHARAIAKNISTTMSNSETINKGNSHTETVGSNMSNSHNSYTNQTTSTNVPIAALNNQNIGLSYLLNRAAGCTQGHTDSCAKGETFSKADAHSVSKLCADNRTKNHNISFSQQNKCVQNALITLADIITRIQTLLRAAPFRYGAYFFSPYPETSTRAAYSFVGLAPDATTFLGPSTVNLFFSDSSSFQCIFDSLSQFKHPHFTCNDEILTATTFIQSSELLSSFYLPSNPSLSLSSNIKKDHFIP